MLAVNNLAKSFANQLISQISVPHGHLTEYFDLEDAGAVFVFIALKEENHVSRK